MAAASIIVEILAKTASFQTDTKRAENQLKSLKKEIQGSKLATDQAYDSFQKTGASLKSLASISFGALGADFIINATDAYTKFTSQLKLATSSQSEFAGAYDSVVRISRTTQGDIESIGNLYARLARATKEAGVEQSQIAVFTETVSAALRVSNAAAKETASVMLQLSQAFGAGRLNGQEFAAIAEGAPILLERLSKSIGQPVGALKELGAEGKITREELLKAFTDKAFLTSLQQQVKEVGTIGSAFQVFRNELTLYIGEADKANGASKALREGVLALAKNLDTIANVALVAVTVGLGRYVAGKGAALNATLAEIAAEQASIASKQKLALANYTVAEAQLAAQIATSKSTLSLANNAALTTATSVARSNLAKAEIALATATASSTASLGLFGRAIGFLGGPLGALVTTLGLGALAFTSFGITAETATEKLKRLQDQAKEGLNPFSLDLENAVRSYNDALSKFEKIKALEPAGMGVSGAVKSAKFELDAAKKILDETVKAANEYNKININPISASTSVGEMPKIDEKYIENLKEQIRLIESSNKLIAQGLPLEDANFIAKSKLAGANDELIVTYLNLASAQKKYLDDRKKEEDLINQLNKLKNEEIPQLKEVNNLLRQGVPLEDAQVIAKFKNIDASGKLTVAYLNLKNEQKALTEEQEKYNKLIEDAKKLNEEYLDPVTKVTQGIERLQSLLGKGLNIEGFGGGVRELINDYNKATNQLFDFESVYKDLTKTVSESFNPQDKDRVLELVASYRALEQQLKDGELGIVEFTAQSQELLKSFDAQAKAVDKLNEVINNTDTKKLEEQRNLIKAIYDEYALGTNEALDSVEELTEAVNSALGRQSESIENTTTFMEAAFKRAAENIQDTLADFLFDPFEDGLDGMLLNFVNVLRRMASEALAVAILKKLFDVEDAKDLTSVIEKSFEGLLDKFKNIFKDFNFSSLFGGGGSGGGGFLSSIGNLFGGFFANGGTPPLNKISVVGERGPELFVPRTAGTIVPNNMLGNGNQQPTNLSTKIINVLDPSLVSQYLRTDEGEKLVMNTIQRNRSALGF